MYIKLNEKNEIISVISVGLPPSGDENWYYVDSATIPPEVAKDMRSYKYVNGEFILREGVYEEKLNRLKAAKMKMMTENCNNVITKGFAHHDGQHYSLKGTDQISLQLLAVRASHGNTTSWKYDNGLYQFYEPSEMISLAEHAFNHATYHQVYLNQLQDQVNKMTTNEEVIPVSYGMDLDDEHTKNLRDHTNNYIPSNDDELGKNEIDYIDYQQVLNGGYY